MNKIIHLLLLSACISLFCISCNKGPKPVDIEGLDTFTDSLTKFSLQYPKNWLKSEVVGTRFVAFSHKDVKTRFSTRATEGFPGAKIDLIVTPLDSSRTIDSVIAKSMILSDKKLYEIADVTIDGVPGKKIAYSYPLEGGMFNGLMYIATKDGSKATTLQIEAFDGTYEKYKTNFEEIAKSLKLAVTPPKVKKEVVPVEADPPTMNLSTRQGDGFTLGIPDNFGAENIGGKGGALKTWSFLGKRRVDCIIKVDMFDASKSKNLKKIADENQAKLSGAGAAQKTTLSGVEAYKIDYKPLGQVKGRVWFALRNSRLYRVTITWFVGEEDKFLPAFEKSIASFKFQ